jgi:hypothetical protein
LVPGRFFIYKRQDLTKKAIDEIVAIKSFLAQQKITDFSVRTEWSTSFRYGPSRCSSRNRHFDLVIDPIAAPFVLLQEVDLTHDHELAGFIKAKCAGKLKYVSRLNPTKRGCIRSLFELCLAFLWYF